MVGIHRIFTLLAILSAITGLPVLCESQLPTIDIPQVTEVTPELWRGAEPDDVVLAALAKNGCKTVIDLRMKDQTAEAIAVRKLGLKYVHIPLGYFAPGRPAVEKFLQITTDPAAQPVFVHCRQGKDRTGVLVGIYRSVVQHWDFDQVYAEMREHHFRPWLWFFRETVEEAQKNYRNPQDSLAVERQKI